MMVELYKIIYIKQNTQRRSFDVIYIAYSELLL